MPERHYFHNHYGMVRFLEGFISYFFTAYDEMHNLSPPPSYQNTRTGLFSGLTLGLMGLDIHGLEIVIAGGDPELAKAAQVSK